MTSLQNSVIVKLNMSVNVIKVATKRIKIGCKTFNPKGEGEGIKYYLTWWLSSGPISRDTSECQNQRAQG